MLLGAIKHAIVNGTTYLYDNNGNKYYSDKRFICPTGVIEYKEIVGIYVLEIWYKKFKGKRIIIRR